MVNLNFNKGYKRIINRDCPYSDKWGRVFEHRYIWWKEYGTKDIIKKGEVIHHINGNKRDNNITNLIKMDIKSHNNLHHFVEPRLRKERKKLWHFKNKDRINIQRKVNRVNNLENIRIKESYYRIKNRERVNYIQRKYLERNRNKINKRRRLNYLNKKVYKEIQLRKLRKEMKDGRKRNKRLANC